MKRPIVFVLLAGTGALLAAVVVFSAIRKREAEVQRAMAHTIEVVVAANDIPLGAKIDADSVKLAHWSRDSVPQGAFTDPAAVAGAFAKGEFVANEPIVASKLFMGEKTSGVMPLLIPSGMRAMSVPVDEVSDIAGFVAPHTRVDVLVAVAGTGPNEPSFSRIVLQDIEVLAVAQEIEHVKDQPEVVKVVTLLVTPSDAEKLTLASREGFLRLAMRNYNDAKIVPTKGIAMNELMHDNNGLASTLPLMEVQPAQSASPRAARLPTAVRLEVMRDGKSSEALSFINTGIGAHSFVQPEPSSSSPSEPQAPPAMRPPDSSESPVSSARSPQSPALVAPAAASLAAIVDKIPPAAGPPDPAALKPGDPGYQPAPRTYVLP